MNGGLHIEQASAGDIDRIMDIFSIAKRFMHSTGNPGQWNGTYPEKELMLNEIRDRHCYVVKDGTGRIIGTFCLILGDDPTYSVIEDGSWLNDEPYGTIHRIASDGTVRGVGHACFEYCSGIIGNLRADTHSDNSPMLALLEKEGFSRCGTIHLKDGSPRIAFQRPVEKSSNNLTK
ncbi:MAG: GNAT family N-acetyltransferase [Candidatus Cryptobacteroides sp.]